MKNFTFSKILRNNTMHRKWTHESVIKLLDESQSSDPVHIIKEKAKALVQKAIDNGWQGPPFDPMRLAAIQGITVLPNEMIQDASLREVSGRPVVEYNPTQNAARMNFSICHEIAHTLFSDYGEEIRNRAMGESRREEQELESLCDIAAAEMLLPHGPFSVDATNADGNLNSLLQLAKKYSASLEAVMLRYTDVTDKDAGIIVCVLQNGKLVVEYSQTSQRREPLLGTGTVIKEGSAPYECFAPGWTERGDYEINGKKYAIETIGLRPSRRTKLPRVGILFQPYEIAASTLDNEIEYVLGDATAPRGTGSKIIVQVVNDKGAVGAGFGRALKERWAATSYNLKEWIADPNTRFGSTRMIEIREGLYVFQILAQRGLAAYGNKAALDYVALKKGLIELSNKASESDSSVHMPLIGAGQAGGDWNTIEELIQNHLIADGIKVKVYELPGRQLPKPIFKQMSLVNSNE